MSNAWLDQQERRREWPHGRGRVACDIPRDDGRPGTYRFVVTFGLCDYGNPRLHWSVTADVTDPRKRRNADEGFIACGTMHGEVLKHFPELAPIVALHLSDDEGVPCHGGANAAYWAGLTEFKTADLYGDIGTVELPHWPTLTEYLRCTEAEARELVELADGDRAKFHEDVMLRFSARWKAEHDAALALFLTYAVEV